MHKHKWTTWKTGPDIEVNVARGNFGDTTDIPAQEKRCKVCGKRKRKAL